MTFLYFLGFSVVGASLLLLGYWQINSYINAEVDRRLQKAIELNTPAVMLVSDIHKNAISNDGVDQKMNNDEDHLRRCALIYNQLYDEDYYFNAEEVVLFSRKNEKRKGIDKAV